MNVVDCRSCGAPLLFAVTESKGRRIPIDADPATGEPRPVADGNLQIVGRRADGTPIVRVNNDGAPYRSHFATCTNPKQHRRSR